MAGTLARSKSVIFALLGALGCIAGWVCGEIFLATTYTFAPNKQVSSSLIASPSEIVLSQVSNAGAPPPPELEVRKNTAAPPPPNPVLRSPSPSPPPPPPEFKERLDRFGAQTGDIQISLIWNNINDLDLHCIDPAGTEIYYNNRKVPSGGELDVDKNVSRPLIENPVENIFWPRGGAPQGKYRVYVDHYRNHGALDPTAFKVSVLVGDERREFEGRITDGQPKQLIHEFFFPASIRLAVSQQLIVHPGNSNSLQVQILRNLHRGPISLKVAGNVQGLTAPDVQTETDQSEVIFPIAVDSQADLGDRQLKLVARGDFPTIEEQFLLKIESPPPVLAIAVSEKIRIIPGTSSTLPLRVFCAGFSAPISLTCEGEDDDLLGLAIPSIELAEGVQDARLEMRAEPTAKFGPRKVQVVGRAGPLIAKASFIAEVEAFPPILHISAPDVLVLNPGVTTAVPVRIARERFSGPVQLEVTGDSTGIDSTPHEIAPGVDEGTILMKALRAAPAGDRSLRIVASAGPFRGERDVKVTLPKPSFPWFSLVTTGLWTGLLATGFCLSLVSGQTWYLSKRLPQWRQYLALTGGGLLAGVVAGVTGQALASGLAQTAFSSQFGFLLGWSLLGALLGGGVGCFVPNLHGGKAALAGAVGGLFGAIAFAAISSLGDFAGRFAGAVILGAALGLVVALVEAAFRAAWLEIAYGGKERRTVNLGPEPIRIGSARHCTIWTPGKDPVALQFWLKDGHLMRQDVPANRTMEVKSGHRERLGTLEIVVHRGTGASVGQTKAPVAPPPPPPPAKSKSPSVPVATATTPQLAEKARPGTSNADAPTIIRRPPPPPPPPPRQPPRPGS